MKCIVIDHAYPLMVLVSHLNDAYQQVSVRLRT
jgi:hypothetical protein